MWQQPRRHLCTSFSPASCTALCSWPQLCDTLRATQALEAGTQVVTSMCNQLEQWGAVVAAAKTKRLHQLVLPPPQLEDRVEALVGGMLQKVYR